MKIKNILWCAVGMMTIMSCADDITTPVLKLQQAAKLKAITPAEVAFTQENSTQNFPEISWEAANYGKGAVVKYTVSVTNNETKKSVELATTEDNKVTFTNEQMNTILAKVGAYPGKTYDFTVSLKSEAFGKITNDAENKVQFKATPYDPHVNKINWKYAYVAVNYPEWDYTNAYLLGDPDGDGTYKGWALFDKECKFAIVDGKDVTKMLADTTKIDKAHVGFVEITLTPDGKVSIEKPCKWSLIGSATSGGWNKDTKMEYDKDTRIWTVITPLTNQEFKFRDEGNRGINYGKGKTNPDVLERNGDSIKVDKTHAYIVRLDLTNAGKYTYSLEETNIELSSAELTLPGSYQNWKPEAENVFKLKSESRDFQYTGIHYFTANTEFKLYDEGKWLGVVGDMKWDETKTKAEFAIGEGPNLKLTDGGYYRITANTKKNIATIEKTGWEIIGTATPNGWEKGTLMTYHSDTKKWTITIKLAEGEYKFRWAGSYAINFGGNLSALTQDGANIKVGAGTYLIELDPDSKKASVTEQ